MTFITAGRKHSSEALLEVQQLSGMDFSTTLLHCQPKSLGICENINKQNNLLETIAVAVLAIATTTAVNSMKKTSQFKQIATAVNTLVILYVSDNSRVRSCQHINLTL